MNEIEVKDYFNMIFDDYNRLIGVQSIGDERKLINAIRNQNDELKRIEQENEQLKKQNKILLAQLVVNDDEDVTVQISQKQFDGYNQLKEDYAELLQRHNDCFEQLEILKRENEGLKKVIKNNETAYITEIGIYNRASENLLKENTELSEENNILKQSENEAKEIIAELKAENKKLRKEKDEEEIKLEEEVETLVMDNARLLQALEEIRIISQNWTNKLMNDGYCEILDKINEVLK